MQAFSEAAPGPSGPLRQQCLPLRSLVGVLTQTALGGGRAPSSLSTALPRGSAVGLGPYEQHHGGLASERECLLLPGRGTPRHLASWECSRLPQSARSLGTEVDTDRNPRDLVAGAAPQGCPGCQPPLCGAVWTLAEAGEQKPRGLMAAGV